ncbi:hypothetical protein LXL04_033734 [Taraxacum kok-saghyz]
MCLLFSLIYPKFKPNTYLLFIFLLDFLSIMSTIATHIIINPVCPATDLFKQRYIERISNTQNPMANAVTLDTLQFTPHSDLIGKAFWVKARISSYDIDNGWFNFSVTLLDSTSEMKVMMTDEAIQSLSQTTCAKLVCEDGEEDRIQLPSLFEEYKTKSFAFQLKLTRRAALIKEHNFIITDVSHRFSANDVAENVEMTPPPVTPTPDSASTLSPSSTDERLTAKSTTRKHFSFTKPNKNDESRPPKQRRG